MTKTIVVQLPNGEGILVRVDMDTEEVKVDWRKEEWHAWTPIQTAGASQWHDRPRYRIENQP